MRFLPILRAVSAIALIAIALIACRGEQVGTGGGAHTSFSTYDAGAVPGGPGARAQYAIGRAAVAADLTTMNVDVGADGSELPAGRGSVAEGAALYATQCAACHGKAGEGIAPAFPALVGRDPKAEKFAFASDAKLTHTIGNYWPYAPPLFDYIKRAMPLASAGSLSNDQVYALTAYLLAANKVIADSTVLDATTLRSVRMPYRDKFVPDDRRPNAVAK